MNEDREGNRDNIVFLEGIKVNQIICLTSRQIKVGEELFVSYGSEVDRSHWDSKSDVSSGGVDEEEGASSKIRGMRAATMTTAAAAVGAGTLQQQQQSIVRMLETLTTAATNGDDESAEDSSRHRLEAQL
ncbi:hypothetical protein LPJ66_003797 [Kickxella alabastrina]|uniref:Uncharacterized protein n=1 Tax=Kickxella alabastrina TaxID=61397 RepID=A0ACC1INK6_9FUNG|nr:hypothetical protein LPJ66_003797 [Kickxella alabastrina]